MKKLVVSAGCLHVADSPLGRVQAKSANLRSSQLRLQVESAASIAITAVSSKNNVTVSVQNSVVSTANYCNSHLCSRSLFCLYPFYVCICCFYWGDLQNRKMTRIPGGNNSMDTSICPEKTCVNA